MLATATQSVLFPRIRVAATGKGLALHWQDRGRQRFGPPYATPVYDEEMRGSRGRYRAARAFSGAVSNQS